MTGTAAAEPRLLDPALAHRIAATLLPGFVGTTLPDWLERRLRDGLGGVCLFGPNIVSAAQLRALTDAIYAANPDAIVAIDEEGGDVTRLHYATGSPYPGNAVLGRLADTGRTEEVARRVGAELRAVGVNLDFAPDVDINSNPDNPVIGVRSFGTSPTVVAEHGAAWVRGLQAAGVAACAKHFPGHGDTDQDSHLELPVVDRSAAELRDRELVPFRAAVEAGTRTVMTSHILLPQLDAAQPATFSTPVVDGLLRGELGFDGVVVTDALDMHGASGERGIPEAAVLALAAGCDLLCLGTENTDEQLAAIERAVAAAIGQGRLSADRVAQAAGRVLRLATDLRAEDGEAVSGAGSVVDPADLDPAEAAAVVAAFDLTDGARRWREAGHRDYTVVRLETVANIAVGTAPWGPFAEAAAEPDASASVAFSSRPTVVLAEDDPAPSTPPAGAIVVIGKDNHRHAFARAAIDRLRASGADVLVVDMGWPADDRRYADIATYGASRLLGRALLDLLGPGS
ncbi:sugar hydrolase [Leifsonia sp. LS1]|uniref:beta-N-acetylhexosaminidase n=1 Tax=Leifsonia sp. LS1 TaxID=2828483 RepID=UPI001CFC8F06|nr:beta-N-acetylhexosaminidase [Leifsonia sp. LS1]GIT79978.1 sugar hydrolase [Leifsonia sp. LS1]